MAVVSKDEVTKSPFGGILAITSWNLLTTHISHAIHRLLLTVPDVVRNNTEPKQL